MPNTVEKAVVSYKVEKPVADWQAGDIVQIEEEEAAALVEAGILAPASQDEVTGGEDEVVEEAPEYVANAAKDLETKLVEAVEKATKKVADKFTTKAHAVTVPKVAATPKDNTWGFK